MPQPTKVIAITDTGLPVFNSNLLDIGWFSIQSNTLSEIGNFERLFILSGSTVGIGSISASEINTNPHQELDGTASILASSTELANGVVGRFFIGNNITALATAKVAFQPIWVQQQYRTISAALPWKPPYGPIQPLYYNYTMTATNIAASVTAAGSITDTFAIFFNEALAGLASITDTQNIIFSQSLPSDGSIPAGTINTQSAQTVSSVVSGSGSLSAAASILASEIVSGSGAMSASETNAFGFIGIGGMQAFTNFDSPGFGVGAISSTVSVLTNAFSTGEMDASAIAIFAGLTTASVSGSGSITGVGVALNSSLLAASGAISGTSSAITNIQIFPTGSVAITSVETFSGFASGSGTITGLGISSNVNPFLSMAATASIVVSQNLNGSGSITNTLSLFQGALIAANGTINDGAGIIISQNLGTIPSGAIGAIGLGAQNAIVSAVGSVASSLATVASNNIFGLGNISNITTEVDVTSQFLFATGNVGSMTFAQSFEPMLVYATGVITIPPPLPTYSQSLTIPEGNIGGLAAFIVGFSVNGSGNVSATGIGSLPVFTSGNVSASATVAHYFPVKSERTPPTPSEKIKRVRKGITPPQQL